VRALIALALVGALALPAGAAAKREGERPAAKQRQACSKAKKPRRCARVRRLSAQRATAERLVAMPPPSSGAPGSGGPGGETGDGTATPPPAWSVSVAAREFSFTLSRWYVDAGSVRIELRNNGEDPHNLVVSPDDGSHAPLASWPDLDPGAYLRKTVTLSPGTYQLWCSILDHEARGMSVDLVVK
jgi:plastocyanin